MQPAAMPGDNSARSDAATLHRKRILYIPDGKPDRMLAMFLHETAEALLRLPVAPEFVHPPTGQDVYHTGEKKFKAFVEEVHFGD